MAQQDETKPAQPNQSIEWGFNILIELAASAEPQNCSQIARRFNIGRTKVSRIMGTLAHLGMVQRLDDYRYIPGPAMHLLSAMGFQSSGLLQHALPHINRIRKKYGLEAALGVMWRDQVCYLFHSLSKEEEYQAFTGHKLWFAPKSSIGQVILASQDDDSIRELFSSSLSAAEMKKLFGKLRKIRKNGYVSSEDDITVALGSPVSAGLAFRGSGNLQKNENLIKEIKHIAAEITAAITHNTNL